MAFFVSVPICALITCYKKTFANLSYEQLHGVLENIMIIWCKYD